MKPGISPKIEVGILSTEYLSFRFDGAFHCRDCDEGFSGELSADLKKGEIEIVREQGPSFTAASILLEPVDENSRFTLRQVVIGIGFHWEQKEDQAFLGAIKLMVLDGKIQVINVVPLEEYLVSVISSEMRGDSSPELLKAHTIISRSWLLAQIEKQEQLSESNTAYELLKESEGEYIRWYDREDHRAFHVCADDHCQRYQGTSRAYNPAVEKAVRETAGEVLLYDGNICDARFSKCCGGVVEEFQNCWEEVRHPYLQRVDDNPADRQINGSDLSMEEKAVEFISGSPDAFCNTRDATILKQVLNDYDQGTSDFYRWEITYTQAEISALIREKSGRDFGEILDLQPVERGSSGRLIKLRIVGSKMSLVVGKELEIRRWLSESHLYSSAFILRKEEVKRGIPGRFILQGAGWGHGVGLCQIGAAVMASKGYSHEAILKHYFIDISIEKRYE